MEEKKKCTCIECKKEFEPYPHEVVCHICDGNGIIETDDDFMRSDYRWCWQCHGKETYLIMERFLCDDACRDAHFDGQFDD